MIYSGGFYFREGTIKCATIEEIEAEKSTIEKDTVSLLCVITQE